MDNWNYPEGSDHAGAPWNEQAPVCSRCEAEDYSCEEDALSGALWCQDCLSGPDPDMARKQEKGE